MLEFLAQTPTDAITPTPAQSLPTPTNTPEDFILNMLTSFESFDIFGIVKIILIVVILVWLFFAVWVLIDASKRYHQWYLPILWFIFVLPLNIIGLIAYVAMRPVLTNQEKEWSELELKYLQYELMSTATCPECHHLINPKHHYCSHCGTHLRWVCEKCQKENIVASRFCVHCGVPHEQDDGVEQTPPPAPQTRKQEKPLVVREKNKIRIKKVNVMSRVGDFWKEYMSSWRWLAHNVRNKFRSK